MQALTSDDKKELCKEAFQDISAILASLRDQGLSDLEIFEFGKSLIDHFDPIKMEILNIMIIYGKFSIINTSRLNNMDF